MYRQDACCWPAAQQPPPAGGGSFFASFNGPAGNAAKLQIVSEMWSGADNADPDLVARYTFESGATDESGHGHDGDAASDLGHRRQSLS